MEIEKYQQYEVDLLLQEQVEMMVDRNNKVCLLDLVNKEEDLLDHLLC